VVGTEDGRALVESTIDYLNGNGSLSRAQIKPAFASLTIGSGSAAVLLTDRKLSPTGNRLLGAECYANTRFSRLCYGGDASAASDPALLMWTDAEGLMHHGVEAARQAFDRFLVSMGWTAGDVAKTFCHQVGRAHQKLLFEALGLDPSIDYATLERLGNTGSVALPMTAALGIAEGHLRKDDRLALLGIGSGINVVMLGVQWQRSLTEASGAVPSPHRRHATSAAEIDVRAIAPQSFKAAH
jgi:3-oxoacyl-[acyl-carrier-protein] synthase-3